MRKRINRTESVAVSEPYTASLQRASRSDMQKNCETDVGWKFVSALIFKPRLRYVLRNMARLMVYAIWVDSFFTIPHFVSIRKKSDGVALLNSQVFRSGRSGTRVAVSVLFRTTNCSIPYNKRKNTRRLSQNLIICHIHSYLSMQ